MYAIIRKRSIFHQLANLPSDTASIQKALQHKKRKSGLSRSGSVASEAADNSRVPVAAEPRMFKASLEATPGMRLQITFPELFGLKYQLNLRPLGIDKITEKAQVSEEGTMVSVSDVPPSVGTSDTESNSDRDHEVATVALVTA